MPPATTDAVKKEFAALPVALIDAQDEAFVSPLREFLTSHGCQVLVNRPTPQTLTYHLIAGDGEFVKDILHARLPAAHKRLVILVRESVGDIKLPAGGEAKLISIDARPLAHEDVEKIFSFFFTGKKNFLDIRKEPAPHAAVALTQEVRRELAPGPALIRKVHGTTHPHPAREEDDQARITSAMRDIFGAKPAHKKFASKTGRAQRLMWRIGGAVLACILLSWVLYASLLALSGAALAWGGRMLLSGNTTSATRVISLAGWSAAAAGRTLPWVGWQLVVLGLGEARAGQERMVSFLSESTLAALGVADILTAGARMSSALFPQDGVGVGRAVAADVAALRTDVSSVQNHLALSQAQLTQLLDTGTFPISPLAASAIGIRAQTTLAALRTTVGETEKLLTLFPHIAGFTRKQTYLMLFQNSMEMRPTGGFIGSVATATFEDGRMSALAVSDVYTLDGQLKGHVDPPAPLRELMGAEHWYLRDSNWDPDFAKSATQAAWFYEKETGARVDGVVAISVPFITDLLRATGPLELTDFNDRVTADNFFGKSLLYTQTDFFPGSTQKKDFLGSLAAALMRRMTQEKGAAAGAILEAVIAGLEGKHILFYFPDPELQALVSRWGWAGATTPIPSLCAGSAEGACPTDGIAVVEANVGVNKANYFVAREALHQIALAEDGTSSQSLTLRYHNASTADTALGGGAYRAYVRLLLPPGASVESVSVNGIALRARAQGAPLPSLPFAQLEEASPEGTTLGIAFEVAPLADLQLAISYKTPVVMRAQDGGSTYALALTKQSGYPQTQWQTTISYPVFWQALLQSPGTALTSVANQGRVEYNTTLTRDSTLRVYFYK